MGGAFRLSISAAILQAMLRAELPPKSHYLAGSYNSLPAQSNLQLPQTMIAYAKASHAVFLFQVPLVGVCLLSCVLIRDHDLERPQEVERYSGKNSLESADKTE